MVNSFMDHSAVTSTADSMSPKFAESELTSHQSENLMSVKQLCQLTSRHEIPLQDVCWSRTTLSPNWMVINHHRQHNISQDGSRTSNLTLINLHRTFSAEPVNFKSTLPIVRAEVHPTRDLIALSTVPILFSSENGSSIIDRRNSNSNHLSPRSESLLSVFVIHSGFPVNSIDLLTLDNAVDNSPGYNSECSIEEEDFQMNSMINGSVDPRGAQYDFFWTWISSDLIGIVTREAVFHWDVFDSDSIPQLIHRRHPKMMPSPYLQITGYIADETCQWFALTGLFMFSTSHDQKNTITPTLSYANFPDESLASSTLPSQSSQASQSCPFPEGVVQIYSRRDDYSQIIEMHAVHFTRHTFSGNQHPSTVLIGARRVSANQTKLHLIELGPIQQGNLSLVSRSESIPWYESQDSMTSNGHHYDSDLTASDFPVIIRTCSALGLIYLLSKRGALFVCDLDSGTHLIRTAVLPLIGDIVFAGVYDSDTHGLLVVTRNGLVLSIDPKVEHIVQALEGTSRRFIAARLQEAHQSLNASITTHL